MDRAQACAKIHVSLKGGTTAEGQTAEHRCMPQRHGAWASAAPGTLPRDSVPSDLASQTRARAGALPVPHACCHTQCHSQQGRCKGLAQRTGTSLLLPGHPRPPRPTLPEIFPDPA